MISDADLDRVLATWLAQGSERAPDADVTAALARVGVTSQRRGVLGRLPASARPSLRDWRWLAVAALLILTVAAIVLVGSGTVRLASVEPDRARPPVPVSTPAPTPRP